MAMTAAQRIKKEILVIAICADTDFWSIVDDEKKITEKTVDELYDKFTDHDDHYDYVNEFRSSGLPTGLPCEYSRHYEATAVATGLRDGSWVGWTYWYGGGKHGNPEAVEWIDDAYFVEMAETEKMVVVREFKKAGK